MMNVGRGRLGREGNRKGRKECEFLFGIRPMRGENWIRP